MRSLQVADKPRLNERALQHLGLDLATINVLRQLTDLASSLSTVYPLEDAQVHMMTIPNARPEQRDELFALVVSVSSELSRLRDEVEALKAQVPTQSLSQINERITNLEAALWLP